MALVDYTSSDSESESESAAEVALKRRKLSRNSNKTCAAVGEDVTGGGGDGANCSKAPARPMPPLPPAFHDLYASTVRVSTSDDPALHQGRKRVNPHKVGNWPTHLYIEWHPTPTERTHLTTLLSDLQTAIATTITTTNSSPPIELTSFLTSDLSAPQPLHISLSRPIVLTTPQRDPFLASLTSHVVRGSRLRAFDLAPRALAWHRGPESARTFLVLRVRSTAATTATTATTAAAASAPGGEEEEEEEKGPPRRRNPQRNQNPSSRVTRSSTAAAAAKLTTTTTTKSVPTTTTKTTPSLPPAPPSNPNPNSNPNPELTLLLRRCNDLVTSYAQPALYADQPPDADADAFHVSLAWTFAPPTPELRALTEQVFARPFFEAAAGAGQGAQQQKTTMMMRIRVDGVKAKIGNAVAHVELLPAAGTGTGRRGSGSSGSGSSRRRGGDDGGGGGGGGVRNGVLGV
ncbi:hypothetical protein F4809DRAFT_659330 [Biscogniauxia mediterranea]|nr:hypothetical protein F4809DRAFT_659330 [Biscogniauxia mediterranea]